MHLDAGFHRPRGDGAAGQQAAAADRHHEHVEIRKILQQFQRQRALAGDDAGIVIGVDENQPLRRGQMMGMRRGLGQHLPMQHHAGAPGRGARHLRRGGEFRHDDGRRHPEQMGVPRHRLGMIAGRHGDDPARRLIGRQQSQTVGRATLLEGARRLQIVELEDDLRPRRPAQAVAADRRACAARGRRYGRPPPRYRRM